MLSVLLILGWAGCGSETREANAPLNTNPSVAANPTATSQDETEASSPPPAPFDAPPTVSTPLSKYSTGPDADQQNSAASSTPLDAPLKTQLDHLLDDLSRREFASLPLKLVGLEKTSHGLTATVDLQELGSPDEPPQSPNWDQFFQGSAGAENTRQLLLKTTLQPSFDGTWIDAVVFHHGGQPGLELDHIDLSPVFTRADLGE